MPSVSLTSPHTSHDFLDLLPTGALIIDSNLHITSWNSMLVEWTSITKEEATGASLTSLFPNLEHPRYLERLTQVFTSGFPATYSAAFHKHFLPAPARHGLDCELMIQQTEVRRLPAAEQLALITIQDVSFQYLQLEQLKQERADLLRSQEQIARINQELLERNKELDDFTRIASHDLKEPLRKITTFGQMLSEHLGTELDEDSSQYLFYMQDAAQRMKVLIQDLMALSRTGLSSLDHSEIELGELVHDVLELLAIPISEKQAQVEVEDLPKLTGDRRLLTQLLQNLIGNAIKFSADDAPLVKITASFQDNQWVVGVQDNGIGILEGHEERIFEPFVKLHSRDEYEGTGFGLSICKKAVTRHGGKIWVESTPGAGAHFKFTLPCSASPNTSPA